MFSLSREREIFFRATVRRFEEVLARAAVPYGFRVATAAAVRRFSSLSTPASITISSATIVTTTTGIIVSSTTRNIATSAATKNSTAATSLNTLGVSLARIDYAAGGLNPPHTHPRATEVVFVLFGELDVGFITTTNTLISKSLKKGMFWQWDPGIGTADAGWRLIFTRYRATDYEGALTDLYDMGFSVEDIGYLAVVNHMLAIDPWKSLLRFWQSLLLLQCETMNFWKYIRATLAKLIPEPLCVEQGVHIASFLGIGLGLQEQLHGNITFTYFPSFMVCTIKSFLASFRAQCNSSVFCTVVFPAWMLDLASQDLK